MAAGRLFSVAQVNFVKHFSKQWPSFQRNITLKSQTAQGVRAKPKKPLNGYLKYTVSVRPEVVAQNPNLSFTELSKLLQKKWLSLPESVRNKYNEESQREMAVYKEKLKKYNESLTPKDKEEMLLEEERQQNQKKAKLVKANLIKLQQQLQKPVRPVNSFFIYCQKRRDESKDNKLKISDLSDEWNKLSKKERDQYSAEFFEQYKAYEKEMEVWEKKMIEGGKIDLVQIKTLKTYLKNIK